MRYSIQDLKCNHFLFIFIFCVNMPRGFICTFDHLYFTVREPMYGQKLRYFLLFARSFTYCTESYDADRHDHFLSFLQPSV